MVCGQKWGDDIHAIAGQVAVGVVGQRVCSVADELVGGVVYVGGDGGDAPLRAMDERPAPSGEA